MPALRPWLVVPATAVVASAVTALLTRDPLLAAAAALLAAALTAAVHAFVGGGGPAALVAGAGGALGVLGWLELGGGARAALAGAAAMAALAELARPRTAASSPFPAVAAGCAAAVLDPSYAALVAVAGAYLVVAPVSRARWVVVVPIAGVLVALVAAIAACGHGAALASSHAGELARLQLAWTGHAPGAGAIAGDSAARAALAALRTVGDRLGPLTSVAGLAGLAWCATRDRLAAAAVLGVVAFTALEDVAGASVGCATPIVAALGAGVALGRLAALVRLPIGQAFVGLTAGALLVAVPAWTLAAAA